MRRTVILKTVVKEAPKSADTLDPVVAYDRIAADFAQLASQRKAYLDGIDRLVGSNIPAGSRSMLDVGAGNGERAVKIARAVGLTDVCLVDPSAEMRRLWPDEVRGWLMRAEELCSVSGEFDVITSLWNVLGHIFPASNRLEVLRQFARLVSRRGNVFLDVNHRYNASHYGLLRTLGRKVYDRIRPDSRNGDVVVAWTVSGRPYQTAGHVFTHRELAAMAEAAGLIIEKKYVIDYASGEQRRWAWQGHLLYVLRATSSKTGDGLA